MSKKLKIVIDTNIFISAFCFGGKSLILLNKVLNLEYKIYFNEKLYNELLNKFNKGRVEKILKNKYNENDVSQLFSKLSKIINMRNTNHIKINSCRDPEDNMILELASFVDADYIVTGLVFQRKYLMSEASDKDLLVLNPFVYSNREFGIDTKVEIVGVGEFLEVAG